jgi:hypothetical protein
MNQTKKKNLVLTFAYRYTWRDLRIFVESLAETESDTELVIFCTRINRATKSELKRHGVKIVDVFIPLLRLRNVFLLVGWWPYRIIFNLLPQFSIKRKLSKLIFNIMCARFSHFHEYLEQHLDKYSNVLIADVRDVYFQSDPFNALDSHRIISFLEEKRIGENESNSRWIREAYGKSELEIYSDKVISCAGVTIGKAEAVFEYLDLMLNELLKVNRMTPVCGVDQAVHNKIFHSHLIENSALMGNGNPICSTMGFVTKYEQNDRGMVVSSKRIISMLHQYDRCTDLKKQVESRYPY